MLYILHHNSWTRMASLFLGTLG